VSNTYRHVHLEPATASVEPDWARLDPLVVLVLERVRRRLEAADSTTAPAPVAPAGSAGPATA
jgi:hypothetical protein